MPSSEFSSDYLNVAVSVSLPDEQEDTSSPRKLIDFINSFPEGSARRMEIEARFFEALAEYLKTLAEYVRESGRLTLYDPE